MPNTVIAIRQSGETGNTPSLGVLANGELAINYADGILYYKTSSNTLGSILTATPGGLDTEVQFNDGGSFGGDSSFTYNKTTNTLTIDNVTTGGLNVAPTLQASFDAANVAQADATGAFAAANTAQADATGAFALANTANTTADAGFNAANTAQADATGAFSAANTAQADATGAFAAANTAQADATGAFSKANSANVLAQAAYNQANTVSGDALAFAIALG